MNAPSQAPTVLFDQSMLAARVCELAAEITRDYSGRELVVIVVLKGSFVFAADLIRAIELPLEVEFLGVRSYGNASSSSGVVEITHDLSRSIEGKDVLLIEDIVDTGLTLRFLLDNLGTRAPRTLKLAALLFKPERCVSSVHIDYRGFVIEDVFVVGYGLDFAQQYRNLPYVGVLDESAL